MLMFTQNKTRSMSTTVTHVLLDLLWVLKGSVVLMFNIPDVYILICAVSSGVSSISLPDVFDIFSESRVKREGES